MPPEPVLYFGDPDVEFELEISDTPVTVDGVPMVVPRGVIICRACWGRGRNLDEISHDDDCPQRFAHSRWYARRATECNQSAGSEPESSSSAS